MMDPTTKPIELKYTSDGTAVLQRYQDFPSRQVQPRNIDVWLPPSYDVDPSRRFPVLYMHDGQNLFDPALSFTQIDWGIDEAITRLAGEARVPETIVVGIWNTSHRAAEYVPQKLVTSYGYVPLLDPYYTQYTTEEIISDHYLAFLVRELKPFIDTAYRTQPKRDSTTIMGSSMGGLISLYACCEYPHVFGGAGCLSTHWVVGDGVMVKYLKEALPRPGRQRFYFDYGTENLDSLYEPYQLRVDEMMSDQGYISGKDWLTCKFAGGDHNERSWRSRLSIPLEFLLRE